MFQVNLLIAARVTKGPVYYFEEIKRLAEKVARSSQLTLIDLGAGIPDELPSAAVRGVIRDSLDEHRLRGYSDLGGSEYLEAVARYMQREFGVLLDPAEEILHCMGSTSALAYLPLMLINPGDVCLMTVPGFPNTGTLTNYLGGEVYNLELFPENDFLPDLDSIPAEIRARAKLLILNYPNNPTGAVATSAFYDSVIRFARENEIVVVNDAAYLGLSYDCAPLSFLSCEGARDVGLEIHSASKLFYLAGLRMGFVAGNAELVQTYGTVKGHIDCGQSGAIQLGAAKALDDPNVHKTVQRKYLRRLRKLVKVLTKHGFQCQVPSGTFFVYTRAPCGTDRGMVFNAAWEAFEHILREASICTIPFDDAGPYLRFSATFIADNLHAEDCLMREIDKRLSQLQLVFRD